MTDDDLIVRHVRLCDCGKPAGHDSICAPPRVAAGLPPDDVQPIDGEALDALVRRGHRHDEKRRAELREQRIVQLRSMSLREVVLEALSPSVESTVPAGSVEPSRGGDGPGLPPRQQLRDDDPRVRLAKQQLRRAAESLIRLRWEDHGWESSAAATVMLGEHKDVEILRCEGARPREVVELLGAQTAGGSRTVERVREAAGNCRWCGQRWPG